MKKIASLAALLVVAAGACAQTACPSTCTKSKDGAAVELVSHQQPAQPEECAAKTECQGAEGATIRAVSFPADMPAMHYVVGDKETCCPEEASQLVSNGGSMQYKIANVVYADHAEAGKAFAAELEHYLDRMTRVSFVVGEECCGCPFQADELAKSTGTAVRYKVGNTVFDCADKAIRAAAMAYGSAQQVKMHYAIDGQETECSESFAKARECTTTKAAYLVAGKETQCDIEAACLLATARIEAAPAAAETVSLG
jgi:hypothetical protein